jgi:hypothetical protein
LFLLFGPRFRTESAEADGVAEGEEKSVVEDNNKSLRGASDGEAKKPSGTEEEEWDERLRTSSAALLGDLENSARRSSAALIGWINEKLADSDDNNGIAESDEEEKKTEDAKKTDEEKTKVAYGQAVYVVTRKLGENPPLTDNFANPEQRRRTDVEYFGCVECTRVSEA